MQARDDIEQTSVHIKFNTHLLNLHLQENECKGWLRGISTGVISSLVTVPFDKVQMNFVINPTLRLKGIFRDKEILTQLKTPFKGYTFVAVSNVARYTCTYMSAPIIEKLLTQQGYSSSWSSYCGYLGAGIIEGFITGPIAVTRQRLFTSHDKSARSVFNNMPYCEMVKRSLACAPYLMLRNSIFWPCYNVFATRLKTTMHLDNEKNRAVKTAKEFFIGATSGVVAAIPSHPLDALLKRMMDKPDLYMMSEPPTIEAVKGHYRNSYIITKNIPSIFYVRNDALEALKVNEAELKNLIREIGAVDPEKPFQNCLLNKNNAERCWAMITQNENYHRPLTSVVDLIKTDTQKYGIQVVNKLFYRGFGMNVVRIVFAMGANYFAMQRADAGYEALKRRDVLSVENSKSVAALIMKSGNPVFKVAPQKTENVEHSNFPKITSAR